MDRIGRQGCSFYSPGCQIATKETKGGSRSSSRDRVRQATGLPLVAMPSGKVKAPRPVDEFAKSYEEGMKNYYMHRYNEYKRLGYSDQERARQNLWVQFGKIVQRLVY